MMSCLNVYQGIYWVNSRFGTPIVQILGLENVILQGRNLHIELAIINSTVVQYVGL